jgi:polyisoprenyl-phosphate glycosyltransferase
MKLSFVVPCYNEEEALNQTSYRLTQLIAELTHTGKIESATVWLVDDGSSDQTWSIIETLATRSPTFVGIKLSRNCGHQNALLAGLLTADGDAVISLDADLQDDLNVVLPMIEEWRQGHDIVYGVRRSRPDDSWFKRWSARRYYALLRRLGVEIIPDHADFRLLSREALQALASYPEANLFLRGLIPQLGSRSAKVYYDRQARVAGETKYPFRKMFGLAVDGVTSFSAVPLRIIAGLGAVIFLMSIAVTLWIIFVRVFTDHAAPGWASTTLPIYALGGIQLLSLGVVGEYVAKIYLEAKRRPRFLIECVTREQRRGRRGGGQGMADPLADQPVRTL